MNGPNLSASFTYDVLDHRTAKTINNQITAYLYDGEDIVSESGSQNAVYTQGPDIDEALLRKSDVYEYYLSDALGSTIALADDTGSIRTSYNYSPFGKEQLSGSSSGNPFRYTGRENDNTGFYYYRARYYSPESMRFIAEDPISIASGSLNFYAYVSNDPINTRDPFGLKGVTVSQERAIAYKSKDSEYPKLLVNPNVTDSGRSSNPPITRDPGLNAPGTEIIIDMTSARIKYEPGEVDKTGTRPDPMGFVKGDDRGHINGNEFGGANRNPDNLIGQNSKSNGNGGDWYKFNKDVRDHLDKSYSSFYLYVLLGYKGTCKRPYAIYAEAVFDDGTDMVFGPKRNKKSPKR
ncbi:MAG: DNA/RNA non-specific endonuclease [Anaerolineae bacterium]|nr:DNA/RNA non-specific endonuclease [Gloeobacterales cyanobacterium ES-bin-313]